MVIDEYGNATNLSKLSQSKRVALARTLLTSQSVTAQVASSRSKHQNHPSQISICSDGNPSSSSSSSPSSSIHTTNKVVLRHLQSGDIVLMNRQPTLHKPSMMAHKVSSPSLSPSLSWFSSLSLCCVGLVLSFFSLFPSLFSLRSVSCRVNNRFGSPPPCPSCPPFFVLCFPPSHSLSLFSLLLPPRFVL